MSSTVEAELQYYRVHFMLDTHAVKGHTVSRNVNVFIR